MCLGRNGDIASLLPLMLHESESGHNPMLCVSQDFADILDGVSYCERIIYPGPYNDPPAGARWLQQHVQGNPVIIAQQYRHPFDRQRLTASYQTESWRMAGALEQFGRHPLVFDRRSAARENELSKFYGTEGMPHILVSFDSVSSLA